MSDKKISYFTMNQEGGNEVNKEWEKYLDIINQRFKDRCISHVYSVKSDDLFMLWLNNLPDEFQQHFSCNACKSFMRKFGGLVTIDDQYNVHSLLFGEFGGVYDRAPEFFRQADEVVADHIQSPVRTCQIKPWIKSYFGEDDKNMWGNPGEGEYTHFHIFKSLLNEINTHNVNLISYSHATDYSKEFGYALEKVRMLSEAVGTYEMKEINMASKLFFSEQLKFPKKFGKQLKWFKNVKSKVDNADSYHHKQIILTKYATEAPLGFVHISSSPLGLLLKRLHISDGNDIQDIIDEFNDVVDSSRYQRPTSVPSKAEVNAAERLFNDLNLENSLSRRFAKLEEVQKIWVPKEKEENHNETSGIFSDLITKEDLEKENENMDSNIDLLPLNMNMRKFLEEFLPKIKNINVCITNNRRYNMTAFVTEAIENSEPIICWDSKEKRNPFSTYSYVNGSIAENWNLENGFHKVTGICRTPISRTMMDIFL